MKTSPLAVLLAMGARLAALAAAGLSACALAAEPVPGLVQEKPSEGRFVETKQGFMVPYQETIAGTDVTFEMVPVPGGKFLIGSPESEAGHQADEGPQVEIEMEPFWIGKYELTWAEYRKYMDAYGIFKGFGTLRGLFNEPPGGDREAQRQVLVKLLEDPAYASLKERLTGKVVDADAVTAPTELYDPSHTFEKGEEPRQPAVTMTQYAARQYTKWLSRLNGEFYRLPTEAEWEYAARAGTKTAYSFGDDPKQLKDYAWYYDNADETTHEVGQKKPNPWGLYDMHGNVGEWVLDAYTEEGYQRLGGTPVHHTKSVIWPGRTYPRVVRGGHWDDNAGALRSAAKLASNDDEWKAYDPNLPLSPWWFTSDPARGVGFRLVRPLAAPPAELLAKYWEADVKAIQLDVGDRLEEGRGAKENANRQLPNDAELLKQIREKLSAATKGE